MVASAVNEIGIARFAALLIITATATVRRWASRYVARKSAGGGRFPCVDAGSRAMVAPPQQSTPTDRPRGVVPVVERGNDYVQHMARLASLVS
jgi:hypothetical protein